MKFGKHLVFTVAAAAFAVLLLTAAALLARAVMGLNNTQREIRSRTSRLDEYYAGNPFPSHANVQTEKENGQLFMTWFKELIGLVRKGQEPPVERSPSNFMSLLGDRRTQLSQLAAKNSVEISPDFSFGFDRYFAAGSTLPAKEDVPRLTEQLLIIDRLSTALFEERVSEVMSIEREEFEALSVGTSTKQKSGRRPAMRGAAAADAGLLGKDALFGKMHFVIQMRTREKALFSVLNRLSREDTFAVVTGVGIEKDDNDVLPVPEEASETAAAPGMSPAAQTNKYPSLSARIISGVEVERPMRVTLDVNVYKFPAE